MDIHLICAQDENGGIGQDGKLPWHISEDLKNFKALTVNSTIIMGRKTWDSLPIKPLPNRKNIILSRTKRCNEITYSSFEECMHKIKKQDLDKIFIIGKKPLSGEVQISGAKNAVLPIMAAALMVKGNSKISVLNCKD